MRQNQVAALAVRFGGRLRVARPQVLHRGQAQVVLGALAQTLLRGRQTAHAMPPLAVQARQLEAA